MTRRVLIAVFDGLQPSQVQPDLMPNLTAFGDRGVRFSRHHAVFPSVTRLNAASMVTGCYPATHGIAGNRFVFRDVDPGRPLDVLEPELRGVDRATGGKVFLVQGLGEILAKHGMEYVAVVSGTSGNAYCHNPNAARSGGAVIHPDFCLPDALLDELNTRFGAWPGPASPNVPRLRHATDLLVDYAIGERNAAVSLVWYSEPDKSQHAAGVGSQLANQALAAADAEFGRLLDAIRKRGEEDATDILVASDHGYSTSLGAVDVASLAGSAGLPGPDGQRGLIVASNGGSALIYVPDADPAIAGSLVEWLVAQPWCGAVFAADRVGAIEGTLPSSLAGIDGTRGPDLAVSMSWRSDSNGNGYPGHAYSAGNAAAGLGEHGSASPHEMNATLVAGGPMFKAGYVSEIPSGNVDLAPTVLHLLGVEPPKMDGRVLREALSSTPSGPVRAAFHTYSARRAFGHGTYRLLASISEVDGVRYLDEARARRERG